MAEFQSDASQPAGSAAQVTRAATPNRDALLGLAVAVFIIAALYFARDVLIPITLAILLSFVLSPVVNLLRRIGLGKAPAVIITVIAALGLLGALGTVIAGQAAVLAEDAPRYAQTVEKKLDSVRTYVTERTGALTSSMTPEKSRSARVAAAERDRAGDPPPTTLDPMTTRPIPVVVTEEALKPLALVQRVLAPVVAPLETFLIVVVVAIFILLQREDLRDRFIRLFGSNDLHRTTTAMDDATARLSRYFLSQLAVNATYGTVIGIGLYLIGVPSAALWGILAGLLRFVPYIGSLIGALLPLALSAAVDPGWTLTIHTALLFVVVEPLIGYVVEPMLYGHSTGLSPISVIVAAVFWTWIWGPVGLILSMPLTLCLVVLGRHVKALEFFDVLLGDRPALSPVDSFYQRMLANDPEEVLDQAETLLGDRSLTAYYDEVALKAMKLAAIDLRRGLLDKPRSIEIVRAMMTVIDELDDHQPTPPGAPSTLGAVGGWLSPTSDDTSDMIAETGSADVVAVSDSWAKPSAILCVAGKGVLDDAVSAMLSQLLTKRGFGATTVRHEAVGRDAIASLPVEGTMMVCLSYLEIGGTPAHLRYLVRRLRARAPGAVILVGLWPDGEAALSDEEIQRTLGADLYAGTLSDAVARCEEAMANASERPEVADVA